jgi:hypothetical protein
MFLSKTKINSWIALNPEVWNPIEPLVVIG